MRYRLLIHIIEFIGWNRKRLAISISSLPEWWRCFPFSICHPFDICWQANVLYGDGYWTICKSKSSSVMGVCTHCKRSWVRYGGCIADCFYILQRHHVLRHHLCWCIIRWHNLRSAMDLMQ